MTIVAKVGLFEFQTIFKGRRFFSLLTLFLVLPPFSILYHLLLPPSTPSSSSFCFLEIIVEARKGRIHILDPTETDPGGARSRDPYPDSSCKITRVRALERRRVYSRKIALACTSARELVCASAALILVLVHALRYIQGKQGELHENTSTHRISSMAFAPYYFNCDQIFR